MGLFRELVHRGDIDRHQFPLLTLQRNHRNIPLTSETSLGFQSLSLNQRNATFAQGLLLAFSSRAIWLPPLRAGVLVPRHSLSGALEGVEAKFHQLLAHPIKKREGKS